LVELAMGAPLPPLVLRGDADLSLAVTLADFQPTSESATLLLREGRVLATEPVEAAKDGMVEFTDLKVTADRAVGGTTRELAVTAKRLKGWIALREPPAGLESRIDCDLAELVASTSL